MVAPGLNEGTVKAGLKMSVPVIPGVATATEVQHAWNLGLRTVKFFPADLNGGVDKINALAAVFRDVSFVPTGGVTAGNLSDYLHCKAVCAVGGSWVAPTKLITEGNFSEITRRAKEAVALVAKIRGNCVRYRER